MAITPCLLLNMKTPLFITPGFRHLFCLFLGGVVLPRLPVGAATSAHQSDAALPRHLPGLFIGVTSGSGEDTFTAGLEYEYRFSPSFGLGAIYERSPQRHHSDGTAVGLVTLNWHPTAVIKLFGGGGRERVFDKKSHRYTVYRIGAAYDFHVGHFALAPSIAVDFVNHQHNLVYGLSFIQPF